MGEPKELYSFTLFQVPKGWQMSTREVGEVGWSVRIIPESEAQLVLNVVQELLLERRLRIEGSTVMGKNPADPLGIRSKRVDQPIELRQRRRVSLAELDEE